MMTITRNVVVLTSHESLHARSLASGNANFDHNSVLIKGGNAHHAHDNDNGYDYHIYDSYDFILGHLLSSIRLSNWMPCDLSQTKVMRILQSAKKRHYMIIM